ncbi:hypothetical protein [Butyribacter intestini]|uniref:hypothetical protein n=1 Tax=Butyribacter intestini TaxID=1703332 RepID=UPI003AF0E5ED
MRAIFSEVSADKKEKTFVLDTKCSREVCKVKNVNGAVTGTMYISEKGRLFIQDAVTKELKYSIAEHKANKTLLARLHPDKYEEIYGKVEEG